MEKYNHTIQEAINLLPDLRYLINKCFVTVYGGFIRWIVEWKSQNQSKNITLKDIHEYLNTADVDLRIKSLKKRGWLCMNLKKIQKYVTRNGNVRIEYVGSGYSNFGKKEILAQEHHEISLKKNKAYKGTYMIWYPHLLDKKRWIRYELTIFNTSTINYYDDFTVNQLTDASLMTLNAYTEPRINEIIDHIEKKILYMFIHHSGTPNLIKKIWRLRKMWNKGFRPLDEKAKQNILENIKAIENSKKSSYVLEDETSVMQPSILNGKSSTIHPTQHKYRKLTWQEIKEDALIKEIIAYCKI